VSRPRFALRTIRGGRVRINGVTFAPNEHHRPYDGRLDNLRMVFGLYYGPPGYQAYRESDGWNVSFVCLWGTEAAYRSPDDDTDWPGPHCIDNVFQWEWWEAVA
jgi:hypothetical protein